MAKRCLHPRLKSFRFKSGEIMTMCPDCKHGENHYDQSTPILGKLYTRYRNAVAQEVDPEVEDCTDTDAEPEDEITVVELTLPTFSSVAALEEEKNYIAPTPELDGEEESGEEIEEGIEVA